MQAADSKRVPFKIRMVLHHKKIFHHGETEKHGEQQKTYEFFSVFLRDRLRALRGEKEFQGSSRKLNYTHQKNAALGATFWLA